MRKKKSSGVQQSIKIEGASTLDRAEIDKMISEAEINAKIDQFLVTFASLAYESDTLFNEIEQKMPKHINISSPVYKYFLGLLQILKNAFILKDFKKITNKYFDELENVYNLICQDIIKTV